MLSSMSCRDFDNWFDHFSCAPFSRFEAEVRHAETRAMLAQIVAGVYNASGRWKKHFDPSDFIPRPVPAAKTVEQQIAIWRGMAG